MKKFFAALLMTCCLFMQSVAAQNAEELIDAYNLKKNVEGGYFAEIYSSRFFYERSKDSRMTAGSIYFLLDKKDISHFHQIDCDEIWYYHAGCGMKIIALWDGQIKEFLLGIDAGQVPMVVIPAKTIFAAENLDKKSFTFISCMTTPQFDCRGFRLVSRSELEKEYPNLPAQILSMAYEKI